MPGGSSVHNLPLQLAVPVSADGRLTREVSGEIDRHRAQDAGIVLRGYFTYNPFLGMVGNQLRHNIAVMP